METFCSNIVALRPLIYANKSFVGYPECLVVLKHILMEFQSEESLAL